MGGGKEKFCNKNFRRIMRQHDYKILKKLTKRKPSFKIRVGKLWNYKVSYGNPAHLKLRLNKKILF